MGYFKNSNGENHFSVCLEFCTLNGGNSVFKYFRTNPMVLPFLLSGTIFQAHKQITQFHAHPDVCCTLFSPTRSPYSSSTPSLCPQIRSRYPNEIIFGLNDGYYAADFDHKVEPSSLSLFFEDFAQL